MALFYLGCLVSFVRQQCLQISEDLLAEAMPSNFLQQPHEVRRDLLQEDVQVDLLIPVHLEVPVSTAQSAHLWLCSP